MPRQLSSQNNHSDPCIQTCQHLLSIYDCPYQDVCTRFLAGIPKETIIGFKKLVKHVSPLPNEHIQTG